MLITAICFIFDIFWLIIVGSVWGKTLTGNNIWNSLSGVHTFSKIMSIINLIIKVVHKFYNFKMIF